MLSSSELAAMQAVASSSLDTACTISRPSTSQTKWGTVDGSTTTIATTTCALAKPTAGIMAQYQAVIGGLVSWIVKLPYGMDVQRNDTLTIGSEVLTVQDLLQPQSYATLTQVLATVIR